MGKILPGVSGSVLAISLNVYEKSIDAISNLFTNFKNNIVYLGFLGIGILISIFLGSKILLFFLNKYYFYTFSLIIGLIIGTVPSLAKEINKKDLIYIFIPLLIICFINNIDIKLNINSIILSFFLGFIEAFTTIIPGISSTAIYISLGVYDFYLNLFTNFFSIQFIVFFTNLIIGIFITSKIVSYLLRKYRRQTYIVIFVFLILSILILIKEIIKLNNFNFILFLLFLMIGFVISKYLDK